MKYSFIIYTIISILLCNIFVYFNPAFASNTIILLDMTGSMNNSIGGGLTKADEAKRVVGEVVIPKLTTGNNNVALWIIGTNSCNDLRYKGDFSSNTNSIKTKLDSQTPHGTTPLAWAIKQSIDDLKRKGESRNLIVVTDGIDACGGDPCKEVINGDAISMNISIHTIGLGMSKNSSDFKVLECIANNSKDGSSHVIDDSTGSPEEVKKEFDEIFKNVVEPMITPIKGELLVSVIDSTGQNKIGIIYKKQG
jgi:hypothetical protein